MDQKDTIDHKSNVSLKRVPSRNLRNSQTVNEVNNRQLSQNKANDLDIVSDSEKENIAVYSQNKPTNRKLHYTDTLDEHMVELRDDHIDM